MYLGKKCYVKLGGRKKSGILSLLDLKERIRPNIEEVKGMHQKHHGKNSSILRRPS